MKNVLIINQSSELYGSDKALLELLKNYPRGYNPIVVLEQDGPLKVKLGELGISVITCPVIKLNSGMINVSGILRLVRDTFKGLFLLRKAVGNTKIDFVHSNSVSIFLGAFYAFLYRKKHLWHVHEIVESPKMVANWYPRVVSFFSSVIVFNSLSSQTWFKTILPKVDRKSTIIHNGQQRLTPESTEQQISDFRRSVFKSQGNAVTLGLVGRISRRKGQMVLLEAFAHLKQKYPALELVFAGSPPPGQNEYLNQVWTGLREHKLEESVHIVDFLEDVWAIYDALDIVVVPSVEIESFGLVATEAMLSSKPVVASRYGGLSEIVLDQQTGYLVEPGSIAQLTEALDKLIADPVLRRQMGLKGFERVVKEFSTDKYVGAFAKVYADLTS